MPCLNEEEGIRLVLSAMPSYVDSVIVVDNGSTDRTPHVAQSLGAKVIHESRRGYGRAYQTGIPAAEGDITVTMDGDASYPPHEIGHVVDPIIDDQADFVSGSRFPLKDTRTMTATSRIGNTGLTLFANMLFLKRMKDSQSGMWAFRNSLYNTIAAKSDGMAFSQELKINALTHPDVRFKEVHISYSPRIGTVKLAWLKDGVLNLSNLFATLIAKQFKRK